MRIRDLRKRRAVCAVLFTLLLSAVGLTNATAQTFTVGNLNYSINSDGATVTVTGHMYGINATGELVIPESVELYGTAYPVTAIGGDAFYGCSGFTGVLTIPESVTLIYDQAFWGCSGFEGSLIIPNSVVFIGNFAFYGCSGFTDLTIGNSLIYTGVSVFEYCSGFTTLYYNAVNCSGLMHIYYWDDGSIHYVEGGNSSSGSSYTYYYYNHWLYGCTSLTTLYIGDNVQSIPNCFLYNRGGFAGNLVIPESVSSIGRNAFDGCSGFTGNLTIPNSVTTIGNYAFNGCTGFTGSLNIGNLVNTISEKAFNGCSGFTGSLNLGNSVTSIGENAFNGCSGFTGSLTIPNLVSSISNNAFSGCSGFSGTLTIGNSVTQIGNSAFFGACEGFTSFDVKPETPPTLGTNVFISANYDMPVLVPCGSLDAYNNASGWNVFTNIQEPDPCLWDITATANPENAGTISGAGTYEQGSTCTLTATANEDYAFVNWTENGEEVSTETSYSFTVTGDRDLVANFRYIRYEITAMANPAEGGTISGIGSYLEGETCTLTAIPNQDCTFINWTENGEEISTDIEYTFVVTGSRDLVANFELPTCTITVTANPSVGGSISFVRSFGFEDGTLQGWSTVDFDGDGKNWYVRSDPYGGDNWELHSHSGSYYVSSFSWYSSAINPNNYLVSPLLSNPIAINYFVAGQPSYLDHYGVYASTSSNNLEDFFLVFEETIPASKDGNGGDNSLKAGEGTRAVAMTQWFDRTVQLPVGTKYVAFRHFNSYDKYFVLLDDIAIIRPEVGEVGGYIMGTDCTMIATPNYGYTFDNWTENGNVVSNDEVYSFTVTGDRNLVANFVKVPFSITVMPNFNDRGTVSGAGEYVIDSTCTLTATPAEGHSFVCWLENGEVVSTEAEYTFTVEGPRDLVAVFSPMEGTYIVFADPNVEAICVNHWDTDGDGFLSYDEAAAVSDIGETFRNHDEITSFNELQYFTGLTSIGYYAFMNCTNLTSVVIPEGVTLLDYKAFAYSGLTEITIPESLNSTNNVVFEGCEALTVMNYNAINCTRVAEYYYSWLTGCNSLTTLNIGENVQSIPWGAFRGCSNLTGELTIPESVTSIASDAFAGTSFTTINYNATNCTYNNTYYYGPFHDCYTPATLHIGENVQTIPEELFSGHTGLIGELALPSMLTSIGESAFAGCSGFTGSLVIPSSVVSIGAGAFYYCSGLTGELNIPASISVIGSGTFQGCSGFTGSLDIPNSVTYIGSYAFSDCTGFNGTITISENVEIVYGDAFANTNFNTMNYNATNAMVGEISDWGEEFGVTFVGLPSLTTLNFGENVQSISNYAFRNLTTLTGILTLPNSLTTIGDQAFYNCYGFESIVMGNSVETIGSEAFRNCGGMRGELTLPETLQSVGIHAFASCDELNTINYNAINCTEMGNAQSPVFYDCASLEHINIGENVESIPNYAFKRCSTVVDMTVAAVAPPTIEASTFGTVSRAIPVNVPFGSGDDYRSAQYWEEFFNIVEGIGQNPYTCHWNANANQFAHNMTAIGIIQIDGVEQTTDALEIGAFCGNECRGSQMLAYYSQVNRYLVFLTLYGEPGDLLTFKLYDHELGEESVLGCTSIVTFEPDGILGTYNNPYVFNFTTVQNTALNEGWSWYSSYVELGNNSLQTMEESLGENGVMIKSQSNGFVINDLGSWMGSLHAVNNESMYLINTSAPCVLSMTGNFSVPSQHTIPMLSGWTWIGYPSAKTVDVNEALVNLNATDGDIIKARNCFAIYAEGNGWFGTLHTLSPGMGFMYHSLSTQSQSFVYGEGSRGVELRENLTAEHNHFVPNVAAYPYNMNVLAVVNLDGEELSSENYELAAFANGECRGSAKLMYVAPMNRYVAFLTAVGNDATTLSFGLYDAANGTVCYDTDDVMIYSNNAIVGSIDEPYVINFRETTGANEFANRINVYPNPVARGEMLNIGMAAEDLGHARVEIVNTLGMTVSSVYAPSVQTIAVPQTAGVYLLRVTMEGKGTYSQKIVVR